MKVFFICIIRERIKVRPTINWIWVCARCFSNSIATMIIYVFFINNRQHRSSNLLHIVLFIFDLIRSYLLALLLFHENHILFPYFDCRSNVIDRVLFMRGTRTMATKLFILSKTPQVTRLSFIRPLCVCMCVSVTHQLWTSHLHVQCFTKSSMLFDVDEKWAPACVFDWQQLFNVHLFRQNGWIVPELSIFAVKRKHFVL